MNKRTVRAGVDRSSRAFSCLQPEVQELHGVWARLSGQAPAGVGHRQPQPRRRGRRCQEHPAVQAASAASSAGPGRSGQCPCAPPFPRLCDVLHGGHVSSYVSRKEVAAIEMAAVLAGEAVGIASGSLIRNSQPDLRRSLHGQPVRCTSLPLFRRKQGWRLLCSAFVESSVEPLFGSAGNCANVEHPSLRDRDNCSLRVQSMVFVCSDQLSRTPVMLSTELCAVRSGTPST